MPVACFGGLDLSHLAKCNHDDTFMKVMNFLCKLRYDNCSVPASMKDMGSTTQRRKSDSTAYCPY